MCVGKSHSEIGSTFQKTLDGNATKVRHARPFLKWAGGKSHLLPKLRSLIPKRFGKYIEPFLGGGALFFDLCPNNAVLSDLNAELINCYIAVRDAPEEILKILKQLPVNAGTYYKTRRLDPSKLSDIKRASRLIYLNKTCYNGLYRVNKRGQFNTPYGKNDKVIVYTPKLILEASKALHSAKLLQGDFGPILLEHASPEDFVYLDPPYLPVGGFSDFTRYTRNSFYKKDHIRLAKVVEELENRCCKFVLSNANHPLVSKIYPRFRKIEVQAPRYISSIGEGRGDVSEVLVTNIWHDEKA